MTYETLRERFPDRADQPGCWAPIHGYELGVVDLGCHFLWSLNHERTDKRGPFFIVGGQARSAEQAWRDGCAALDIERAG